MAEKRFLVKNGIKVYADAIIDDSLSVGGDLIVTGGLTAATLTGQYQGFDSDFSVSLGNITTDSVSEGSNLYYTEARVNTVFGKRTTDSLGEGSSNLYYTTARHDSDFSAIIANTSTDSLGEGSTNLYFTNARVNSVLASDPSISGVNFYGESSGGLSLNEDVNLGDSTTTVFNISAETSSKDIAYSLNIPSQVNATIGLTGTDADNEFIIGFEQANTEFKIKSGVGGSPVNLGGGTTLLTLGTTGNLNLTSAQQSTNKTTGSITTAGGIGVDKDVRAENFIAVNNVTAGTNGTGKFIGDVTGTVSDISNHTTTDLTEGNNLYYTTARFDSDLLNTSTSGLPEGNNLYYTTARADSDAKKAISVNNSGGFGTLSYVDSTGVISYQGPTTAEIRSQFTAGTGVTITSGQISIGQDVGLTDSVQFQAGTFSGDVVVNGNLTVVGTQTVTTQNELRISNALLKVADSNYADTVDIGVVGSYSDDGTILRRAGFFRDATNGEWYAFNNLRQNGLDSSSPDQTINTADSSFELGTWNFKALRGSYLGFDSDFRVFSTNYVEYDSDFTAVTAGRYALNTTSGGFTVTLPASPTTGDYIKLIDVGNWTANPVTVNRNGSTIEGYSDNFQLDLGQSIIELIFINSTWQVYSSIGQRGPQGPKGDSAETASFASPAQAIAYSIALG